MALSDYDLTPEDLTFMGDLGDFEVEFTNDLADDSDTVSDPDSAADPADPDNLAPMVEDTSDLAHEIAQHAITEPETFAACMNDLGALYYMGELVPQDYDRAAELYTMAADNGCYQSIINLGYIHEYGRTGTPDPQAAYRCYALAAALAPSSEALYKLGDMYSRGKAVPRNVRRAHDLWERSLEQSTSIVETAQPAIRIAQLLVGPDRELAGLESDPLRALSLFQQAEIGLRIDIANGASYYRRRLQQAIDGQQQARDLMDLPRLE